MTELLSPGLEEHITGGAGLKIFVRSWRPSGSTRGAVVICHGVNSHSGYYLWTAQQLVARGLAVYALDLHGRGQSEGERFYLESMKDYVDDVDAVMMLAKSREPGVPVFLLGHSAGGVVSCTYTLEHQAKLAGLICESFAFQVAAPDFALSVVKGLAHVAPHVHVLTLKNEEFSRIQEVVDAMNANSGLALSTLKVDGGMTADNLLMQMIADVLDVPLVRPLAVETVSLGAAYAAGLAVGFWPDLDGLRRNWHIAGQWMPAMDPAVRASEYANWRRAVERTFDWIQQ